jgi:phosphate transport system protein
MEIRKTFHNRLKEIQDDVLIMGNMVEKAIMRSVEALKKRDLEMANKVVAGDLQINEKRFDIEEQCINLFATQKPMYGDLRMIVSVLNIITDLERIGDYADGIAKIAIMLSDEPPLKPLIDIPRMAEKVSSMLHRSLDAFIRQDSQTARHIADEDDEIDELHSQVLRELLTYMAEDPKSITRATRLIWVNQNLERCGDRITNICERVIFLVTGKMEEIGSSKY